MKSWQSLWNEVESAPAPPSDPTKVRCSSLPYRKHCTFMEQGPAGWHATRGRALHAIMEFDSMPFDIPADDEKEVELAKMAMESLAGDCWELFEKEKFLKNGRLTGNLDLIFTRGSAMAYVDLKFGKKAIFNDSPQLAGGVELLMDTYGHIYSEFWSGIIQPFTMGWNMSIALKKWDEEEARSVVTEMIKEKQNMSDSCGYCVRWMNDECPAFSNAIEELKQWK